MWWFHDIVRWFTSFKQLPPLTNLTCFHEYNPLRVVWQTSLVNPNGCSWGTSANGWFTPANHKFIGENDDKPCFFGGYGVQGGCPKWNNVLDHQSWQGSPKKIRQSHIFNPPSSHQGPSILQSSHLNGVAQGSAWSSWQGFPLPSFSHLEGVGKTGVLSFWPWNMSKNRCVYRTWMNLVHFQVVQCPLTPSHPCLCHGILPDWYLEPYFLPANAANLSSQTAAVAFLCIYLRLPVCLLI